MSVRVVAWATADCNGCRDGWERMEFYSSKPKLIGMLVLTAGMVAASMICTRLDQPMAVVAGWIGVVAFGVGFVVVPLQLSRTTPQIIINDLGIDDRRAGWGLIAWSDIRRISVARFYATKFLSIEVENPQIYLARMPFYKRWPMRANAALGFSPITVTFAGLTPTLDDAVEAIGTRWKRWHWNEA